MKFSIIPIFILLFSFCGTAFSQNGNIIIKLKSSAPSDVVNNFKNNSVKSGNSSISALSRDADVKSSAEVFKKSNAKYAGNESYKKAGLDRIFIIEVNENNLAKFLSSASKNEYVEYIQPVGILRVDNISENAVTPNDTYFSTQAYLDQIGMRSAWDITQGDSNIVIGVIDTGLDFLHPDLQTSYKINYGEYGEGKQDNGIDDDNNGFIDDWRGWDFTDEPFTGDPRRGDYLEPDNDPTDDNKNSHGTAVTGIINATFNNNLGISSVAPNSKVMVLRAFDAEGYGEEDDVANAILYGISNGVKIFNFSFGDYIFSNLLRDVIRFAYTQDVFIVCSAGNDG
ncbi:MAG: S8 family serine peptidase, partial [Ignavibacteria bacterium]